MRYRVQRVVDWSVNHVEKFRTFSFGSRAGPQHLGSSQAPTASAAAMLPLFPAVTGQANAASDGIVQVNDREKWKKKKWSNNNWNGNWNNNNHNWKYRKHRRGYGNWNNNNHNWKYSQASPRL